MSVAEICEGRERGRVGKGEEDVMEWLVLSLAYSIYIAFVTSMASRENGSQNRRALSVFATPKKGHPFWDLALTVYSHLILQGTKEVQEGVEVFKAP